MVLDLANNMKQLFLYAEHVKEFTDFGPLLASIEAGERLAGESAKFICAYCSKRALSVYNANLHRALLVINHIPGYLPDFKLGCKERDMVNDLMKRFASFREEFHLGVSIGVLQQGARRFEYLPLILIFGVMVSFQKG